MSERLRSELQQRAYMVRRCLLKTLKPLQCLYTQNLDRSIIAPF